MISWIRSFVSIVIIKSYICTASLMMISLFFGYHWLSWNWFLFHLERNIEGQIWDHNTECYRWRHHHEIYFWGIICDDLFFSCLRRELSNDGPLPLQAHWSSSSGLVMSRIGTGKTVNSLRSGEKCLYHCTGPWHDACSENLGNKLHWVIPIKNPDDISTGDVMRFCIINLDRH